jgi:hypothetical protein
MEQVKKQRQPAEAMDVIQILEESMGSREEAIKLYNVLADLVNTDPNVRVMRSGNTLFVYYNNQDGSVSIAMETADSPRDLIAAIQEFKRAMKVAGFKTAMFTVENPQLTRLLEMAGIPVQIQSSNVPSESGAPEMIGIGEF